ncbi:CocE/NonD family hydrolase [Flavobacterium sp. J27]|uniref:CocE/NonD family hydrolase n=1 Tax=Flavobacterium sp. J27 TaxID=2060419 RepID=UPI001032447B|nr:CocE/NonD family hydrolase [Flavobacterium sp. J27]
MKKYFYILLFLCSISTILGQQSVTQDSLYVIQDDVLIPTKSGVALSAIIVQKKEGNTPLPVVLFYTTYYQGKSDAYFAKLSADKGYVGVVTYARGIKTDLKDYAPYEHETSDIYDVIDWLSKQSWCNGTVGMYGGSYTGFSQWATTKNVHPALKTIVPQVAVMPGFDAPMENNVQMNLGLYWSHDNIYKKEPLRRSLPFEWFEKGIAFKKMDSLAGYKNLIFQKWLSHPDYDSYWQSMVPSPDEYAKINIPILTTTGYYDGSQIGAIQYFKLHHKYNKNANHYFVIGPYDHWGAQRKPSKKVMGYTIDEVASINMLDLAYDWLDYILKGKPKPEILKDKVNYQVMGTNEWKHASSLKMINNDTLSFYLNQGKLTNNKPKKSNFEKQIVDFKNRENQNNYYTPEIIFDSLDISNGIRFESQPFENAFSINGSFIGNLFATINKKDMDISVALYELMPNGNYFFLTRYVGRASYSKNNEKRQLLTPNKKESIPFSTTRFISKQISKGSRLIILLNINKHPFEIINYGSGKPVSEETIKDAKEPLEIKWHNESFIKIPVWK